jgi:superfamily II DNA helicase RecQ
MRARVLTLRFSPALGAFDDAALQELVGMHDLLELREHVVTVEGQPHIVCVATWHSEAPALAAASAAPSRNGRPVPEILQGLDDAQRALFETIRQWRASTAHAEGVPPYVLLTNRQLVEIVKQRPDTCAGLRRIDGLGAKKLDRYGQALLALLHPAAAEAAP